LIDWSNIPIGVGIAVLLMRETSRFIQERQHGKNGSTERDRLSSWEQRQREVVYTELDRHVIPRLDEMQRVLAAMHDNVREIRWRGQQRKNE